MPRKKQKWGYEWGGRSESPARLWEDLTETVGDVVLVPLRSRPRTTPMVETGIVANRRVPRRPQLAWVRSYFDVERRTNHTLHVSCLV